VVNELVGAILEEEEPREKGRYVEEEGVDVRHVGFKV